MQLKRSDEIAVPKRVASYLRTRIEAGELRPGDRLLPERKLAEQLNVSRTAVREALAELSGGAYVELTPQGAVVRERDLSHVAQVFRTIAASKHSDVLYLLETREIVETQAARLAALRIEEADLQRLRTFAQEIQNALLAGHDASDADTNFHLLVVDCAKNPILSKVFAVLDDAMRSLYRPTRSEMLSEPELSAAFLGEHWALINALSDRDGERAAAILTDHIGRALAFARRRLQEELDAEPHDRGRASP
jgi:GntR family transcriptional regulator, transcriptional repressor for pyruvate dehydrogenase complex